MNERFKNMTDSIVTRQQSEFFNLKFRIDDMSERIDDLEKTVCKLVEESNINESASNMIEKNNKPPSSDQTITKFKQEFTEFINNRKKYFL